MADVELRVLGPVGLVVDGEAMALGGARQRALVAFLALSGGQPVPTPHLVDEVWGAAAPRTVVKSLSTLASRLRHVLSPVGIELRFDHKGYVLDLPEGTLDLHRFRAHLGRARVAELEGDSARAIEHLRMAVRRWRGSPLDGLSAPFVDGAAAELEAERDDTEARLAALLLAADDLEGAIELLLGLLDRNPYREERWASLMEAYTRSGRRAEALAAYQRAHRVLRDELGVAPGPSLRAAEQAALNTPANPAPARRHHGPARSAASGGRPAGPTRRSGREAELALLEREARTAALGELRAVVITGEPGIGKSHLVRSFVDSMADRDLVVLEGRCDPFGTVPLGPLLTLVEKADDVGVIDGSLLAETPALLDALAGGSNEHSISDAGDLHRSQLLRDLRLVMRRFSITRPVAVILEDFHWVDPLTAAALRYLGEEQRQAPVLFIVTAREPDVSRGPGAEVLDALDRTQQITRVHVGPIGRDALADVLADVLDGADDPQRVLDLITEGAGGNPLYARQLARHILEHDLDDEALPVDLRHLMLARIRTIPEEGRELLVLASVLGSTFTLDQLAIVFSDDRSGLERRCALAHEAGLLEPVAGTDEWRFVHGLMRRAAYELADPHQQALLHQAAAMIFGWGRGPANPEIVRHLHLARPVVDDATVAAALIEAARRSLRFGAHEMVLALAEFGSDLVLEPGIQAELSLLSGVALVSLGDQEGSAQLDEAHAVAQEVERWDLVADALFARSRVARLLSVREARRRAEQLSEVLERGDLGPVRRVLLLCVRADAELVFDPSGAQATITQLAELADAMGRPELDNHLRQLRVALRSAQGAPPAEVAAEAMALVEEFVGADDLINAAFAGGLAQEARIRAGHLRACIEDGPRLMGVAEAAGRADLAHQIRSTVVSATLVREPLGVGDQASEELSTEPMGAGTSVRSATRLLHLWLVRREQARLTDATSFFENATGTLVRPGSEVWLAAYLLEQGQLDEARALLEPVPEELLRAPADWTRPAMVAVLVDLALDLGLHLDVRRFVPILRPLAGQNVVAGGWVQVLGRADRYLGRLEHLRGDLDAAVAHHARARQLEQGGGSPLWGAWAAHDEALARLARSGPGDVAVAQALVDGGRRTARRLGARRLAAALRALLT